MSVEHPHHPGAEVGTKWTADFEHHLVVMSYHTFEDGQLDRHDHVINPLAALDLAQALTSAARYALDCQVRDAVAGDCARCGNVRLTGGPAPGGRTQRVNCPECRTTWDDEIPPTFPQLHDVELFLLRGRKPS